MSPSEFLSESCSYHINGTNGASSSPYVKELRVLEACDDEYGGVVVNAKKLPLKLNAFASALRSSLSHWRTTVNITMITDAAKVLEQLVDLSVFQGNGIGVCVHISNL